MTQTSPYLQLAGQLTQDIGAGVYPVGSKLPTEAELCVTSGLSRGTVRRALKQIEALGMISRQQRNGTSVISSAPVDNYRPLIMSSDDNLNLILHTRIVTPCVSEVVANTALARRLRAPRGSRWHVIEGVRVRRGVREPPLCWSEMYLSRSHVTADSEELRRGVSSMPPILDWTYKVEQTVSAAPLDPELAVLLETDCTTALLVTRRHRDDRGRLAGVGFYTHPADRYEITTVYDPAAQHDPS